MHQPKGCNVIYGETMGFNGARKRMVLAEVQGLEGEVLRRTVQQDAVKRTLLNLIIMRRLPFSCVEWPEFHAFVKALNRESPSFIPIHHSTITEWIVEHFAQSQDTVRKVLQSAKTNIHLAVDIWTSPSHSLLLGICASFVDIQDKYQNSLIALRTVHSQSGADQWEALRPVLIEYGIETKIGALVGDNAGSNDVLCRMIGQYLSLKHKIAWTATHQRIRCQGHVINLIVQAFLFSSKKDEKLMELYDKEDEEQEGEEAEEEALQSIPLPAKSKDRRRKKNEEIGWELLPDENGRNIRDIMGPMGKLHNNVVHIRKSANRTTWFKDRAGKIIPLDNRTRWNSWFTMLSVALEDKVKAALQLYVEHYQDNISKDDILTTSEWVQLRSIHDFLQSFHEATLYLQGDRTTLERALESIDILQSIIQTTLETANKAKDKFMAPRLQRAQEKCATYVQRLDDSPYYLAARILNPQCRIAFLKDGNGRIITEGEKKLYIVRKLWERFRDKLPFSAALYESESVGKHALQPEENLSAFHKVRRMQILKQTRPPSQDEFDNYINENPVMLDNDTTAIQWWSQPIQHGRYPRLSQLAIEVLSIPSKSKFSRYPE
ncbi:conserved hypothetical protein [Talaromyces stipitatus ATCC 10500]|uniref:HAT C-terminal dimerisation domain-containing protein n=1 Tax=Talaromyces stipitatus (strain ATCC 10500 / CBS 375.48 / QM 6759 / NRRL 1006) TaxID=441959 RepID=B8MN13_TALSN|nr:uncharacterized protein TSTA_101980 [Talaromyces stipitatus ATCC 10500]EED13962.1 conserved hypothetical protein [Talaromyces stipitatus ATCC 10500]